MDSPDSGDAIASITAPNEDLTDEDLVALGEVGALLATIFGAASVEDEKGFVDQLVTLHNIGRIDLLSLPLGELIHLESHDFFEGHVRFSQMIPRLNGDPAPMMRLVNALVTRAGEDLASNMPNAAFGEWVKADPARAETGLALEAAGDPDAAKLLRFNLEAGGYVDLALEYALASEPGRRLPAIMALAHMPPESGQASKVLERLKDALEAHPDDLTAANVLNAIVKIGSRKEQPNEAVLLDAVTAVLLRAGPQTHYAAASAIGRSELSAAAVKGLLDVVVDVDRSHNATIQILDAGLASLLTGASADLAEQTIERILTREVDPLPASSLISTGRQLLAQPADRLSRLFVRWLLSGHAALRDALDEITEADHEGALAITIAGQALSPLDQLMICRRACGYFFVKPKVAASVLIAVLRDGAPEIRQDVTELLFDPLASNYHGLVRDYLDHIESSDPAYDAVSTVRDRVARYHAELEKVGFLNELEPSPSQRLMEAQRSASAMREAYKKAELNSVFLGLVSRVTLLHGAGSLSYFRGPMEQTDRSMVTPLQGRSYSFELPREDVLDPVGLALKILGLKFGVLRP